MKKIFLYALFQRLSFLVPADYIEKLENDIKELTDGQGAINISFDNWEILDSEVLKKGTKANEIATNLRNIKGIAPDILILHPDKY
mgnify:CR=1 FL=1